MVQCPERVHDVITVYFVSLITFRKKPIRAFLIETRKLIGQIREKGSGPGFYIRRLSSLHHNGR
jgi:hypothetical protein